MAATNNSYSHMKQLFLRPRALAMLLASIWFLGQVPVRSQCSLSGLGLNDGPLVFTKGPINWRVYYTDDSVTDPDYCSAPIARSITNIIDRVYGDASPADRLTARGSNGGHQKQPGTRHTKRPQNSRVGTPLRGCVIKNILGHDRLE